MSTGNYVRTKEYKEKMSQSMKKAISEGRLPKLFKKGHIPHNKGKKGYTNSGSYKNGHNPSKEVRRKQGLVKKGYIPWNKGKHPEYVQGKNNPAFNNWSSREPYGKSFSPKLKEQIRKRDKYRCQECFRHQEELRDKNNRRYKLIIHHIDYNKQNNNPNNLISLCRGCHGQTNFKRKDWTEYFKTNWAEV